MIEKSLADYRESSAKRIASSAEAKLKFKPTEEFFMNVNFISTNAVFDQYLQGKSIRRIF